MIRWSRLTTPARFLVNSKPERIAGTPRQTTARRLAVGWRMSVRIWLHGALRNNNPLKSPSDEGLFYASNGRTNNGDG